MIETYDLSKLVIPALNWFYQNKRALPWREGKNPYHIWVSEIMLQQTRVEAVKPYYDRFLAQLPDPAALAAAQEERLLKLWEGLGYYNRVRNMQKAAQIMVERYDGKMPETFEEIIALPGIGPYTAGAVSSIAFGEPVPAVDGNVLRILARVSEDDSDILKDSTKKIFTKKINEIMPQDVPGDFNQALMEIGALVCVPNGTPRCDICPWQKFCLARIHDRICELPVKKNAKERRIERRTVMIIRDGEKILLRKRPFGGLLAGLYELPNVLGDLKEKEIVAYTKDRGLEPLRVQRLPDAKHIFSHVEWHMRGFMVQVADMESFDGRGQSVCGGGGIHADAENAEKPADCFLVPVDQIRTDYPIPAAFEAYAAYVNLTIGMTKGEKSLKNQTRGV